MEAKNRVIKFRAYDKKEKRYWTQKEMEEIGGYYYNFGVSDNDGKFDLQQFTGLSDKNGVLIYEGDVVIGKAEKWIIQYHEDSMGFILTKDLDDKNAKSFRRKLSEKRESRATETLEVIGNIWEDENLLNNL